MMKADEIKESILVMLRNVEIAVNLKPMFDAIDELERKAKVYDDVMAIRDHPDYLLTIVVADLVNNSESTFFNEKGIEMFVDVRRLRETKIERE